LSTKARGRIVRAIAACTHAGPFGGQHRVTLTVTPNLVIAQV
jgi:hypothetical protein